MSVRTIFLSKLIGLYCILAALCMTINRQVTVEAAITLLHNSSMTLVLGVFTLVGGLAMVLAHNVWKGGALPVIVTLAGWAALIKGVLFLMLPPDAEAGFFLGALHFQQLFYASMAFKLALGIYLTYGGFSSTSHP